MRTTSTNQPSPSARNEVLSRLVGDTETFLKHWELESVVTAADTTVGEAFDLERAFSLLRAPGLPVSSFRLFRDGEPVPQEEFATPRGRPGPGREPIANGRALLNAYEQGATVIFEELRLLVPEVDALACGLEEELGFGVYCAAFLTPAGNAGVRPHFDLASGLLCQIHGSKAWRVGLPETVWPLVPSGDSRPEFEPVLETVLRSGETLYIPRGHPHAGTATEEVSLHLSFAIKPRTWRDVLQAHLKSEDLEESLREMLPLDHRELTRGELVASAVERLRTTTR
ncbi:JmjC domain-containing protein [Nocardiopsis alkaliphila]|uniref:JmjC domain-containing protein n=1 Tax=Nocardiopsis alkaliphila TaxID=225762 RepID=UPI00034D26A4|nr:cupin domain-containing protein [Nocardiopsis alkaliphila]